MKNFIQLTQTDAFGSDAPGEPFAIRVDCILSYAAHKATSGTGEITGTMILFSGSHGEMNSSFVNEPYEEVKRLVREAQEADDKARYAVEMDVITSVIDIMAAGVEKWGPIVKAKLNER